MYKYAQEDTHNKPCILVYLGSKIISFSESKANNPRVHAYRALMKQLHHTPYTSQSQLVQNHLMGSWKLYKVL